MNIIYFNPDEMRADVLGCYGHGLVKTPNIDRFAAQGVRFDQCHVQHTVCSPSRCSFMTGWYPHVRGHRTLWHLLRPDEPHTMKYLKQAGYDVHWIGKNDLLATESMGDSVTEIHPWRNESKADRAAKGEAHHLSFLFGPLTGKSCDDDIVEKAVQFLNDRQQDDKPFFLYLPTLYPHCPYTCPEPFYSMYNPDDLPPMPQPPTPESGKPDFVNLIRQYRGLDKLDEKEFRKIMAVYLGMVSYVDHLFGKLLDAVERNGFTDNTAIFFFSDHGDWPGTHGLVEKWPSALDDGLTRVPMIVHIPGCSAEHVVPEPIECFDIMPTTLELAGIEIKHTHFARSMLPQLHGASGDSTRMVFAEGGYDPHEPHCFEGRPQDGICGNAEGIYYPKGMQQQENPQSISRAVMIRTMTHKLVVRPGGMDELYDMVADPHETKNRIDDPTLASIRQRLERYMLEWMVHTSDVTPWDENPRGFAAL